MMCMMYDVLVHPQSGYRNAKAGFVTLWAFMNKAAETHMGCPNEHVPEEIRKLLDANGFTKPPDKETKQGM